MFPFEKIDAFLHRLPGTHFGVLVVSLDVVIELGEGSQEVA